MKVYPIITKDGVKDSGIDLRDYIAISAMQALIANPHYEGYTVPVKSYQMADAMLVARKEANGKV